MKEIWIAIALVTGDGIPYPTYVLKAEPPALFSEYNQCQKALEQWQATSPLFSPPVTLKVTVAGKCVLYPVR